MSELVLHALPPSHPCMTVDAALRLKGLDFERIDLSPGEHNAKMEEIYGDGHKTVPGLLVDGEPVHGSRPILARLEELTPEPPLFPSGRADAVREAERWGDDELQDLGRRLPWGAMHFRPEAMGTFGGGGPLDPAGTDFAMRYVHASWKYHGITAQRLADDLAGLPAKLDHVDALAADGVIGGDEPTAADLQIGATLRVLLTLGRPAPAARGARRRARRPRLVPGLPGRHPGGRVPRRLGARALTQSTCCWSHSSSSPSCHSAEPSRFVRCALGSASIASTTSGRNRPRSRASGASSASRTIPSTGSSRSVSAGTGK